MHRAIPVQTVKGRWVVMAGPTEKPGSLVQGEGDGIANTTKGVEPGGVRGRHLVGDPTARHCATGLPPSDRRVAPADFDEGDSAIEYGARIGVARPRDFRGDHARVDRAGDVFAGGIADTVSGRLACAEAAGHRDVSLMRLRPSA